MVQGIIPRGWGRTPMRMKMSPVFLKKQYKYTNGLG